MRYHPSLRDMVRPFFFSTLAAFTLTACNDVSMAPAPAAAPAPPGPLTITSTSLQIGIVGQPYADAVGGSGGTTPYVWSVSPALPLNLQLNTTTGAIIGTPTGASDLSHTFTLQDSASPIAQVQKVLQLQAVSPPPVLTILTTVLPDGTVTQPYSHTVQAAGGAGTLMWNLAGGALPQTFTLNPSTGVISGPATGPPASTSNFTVRVADAGGQVDMQGLSLTITLPPPPTITTTTLPGGTAGTAYSQSIQAAGGTGALTWSINAGTLPPPLTINPTSGVISGTPSGAGSFNFTVRATDTLNQFDDQPLSMSVDPASVPPTITTSSLLGGTVNTAYSQQVEATGGTGALTWSISAGTLPPPLTINPTSGVISGTPSGAGAFDFTVRATDTLNLSDTQALSIAVGLPPPPTITTTTLPGGTVGTAYNQTLAATGGTGTRTWSLASGSLPANLALSSSGVISGTPTNTGASNFTARVTDALSQTDNQALSISIVAAPVPLNITTTVLPNGTVGTAYSQTLQATGGTGTRTWSLASGSLPANLALSSSGVISGTPTNTGASNFTARVTDALSQTDNQALSITIVTATAPLTITTNSLPDGRRNQAYTATLTASGGSPPYTWSVSPALPSGLTLAAATGVISGTPTGTSDDEYDFTVRDSTGQTRTKELDLEIKN